MKPGRFITIEGIEGVGKTTAIEFVHNQLLQYGINVTVTREPGGTEISEKIRQLLLAHHEEVMASDTELLLMFASRAQHLANLIKPNLDSGHWVLCDRFTDASFAYQGGGRGIAENRIQAIADWTHAGLQSDYVLLMDAPVEVALARAKRRGDPDRIESEQHHFFKRVRETYLKRAASDTARYFVIDAGLTLDHVATQLKNAVRSIIEIDND